MPQSQAEYSPALWCPSPNRSPRLSVPVDRIVIHITDGAPSFTNCVERFQRPETAASPHFVVGRAGEIAQLVSLSRSAWHAKGWNAQSVGIEHVARSPGELKSWPGLSLQKRLKLVETEEAARSDHDPGLAVTEEQIAASAALVRWLCQRLGLPMDREHIRGHYECPGTSHSDCGLGADDGGIWPWVEYMQAVGS